MAVKHLGNAGSHPGLKVEARDVFDGFDILEKILLRVTGRSTPSSPRWSGRSTGGRGQGKPRSRETADAGKRKCVQKAFAKLGTLDPRVVAYHEAAHIVVGEHLGKKLVEVYLDDVPGRAGLTKMEWGKETPPPEHRAKDAIICLAGGVMDVNLVGKIDTGDTDFDQALWRRASLAITKRTQCRQLPQLVAAAHAIVKQRIGEVVEIATNQTPHKKLSREELIGKSTIAVPGHGSRQPGVIAFEPPPPS